jgi:hypothetical protein
MDQTACLSLQVLELVYINHIQYLLLCVLLIVPALFAVLHNYSSSLHWVSLTHNCYSMWHYHDVHYVCMCAEHMRLVACVNCSIDFIAARCAVIHDVTLTYCCWLPQCTLSDHVDCTYNRFVGHTSTQPDGYLEQRWECDSGVRTTKCMVKLFTLLLQHTEGLAFVTSDRHGMLLQEIVKVYIYIRTILMW